MLRVGTVGLPVEIGLRVLGLWPGMPYSGLPRLLLGISMGMVQACQYWYSVVHFGMGNLLNLMDGVSTALSYSVIFSKMLVLWSNQRIVYDMLSTMADDWKQFDDTEYNVQSMVAKAKISKRCSSAIVCLYALAVFLYASSILLPQDSPVLDDIEENISRQIRPLAERELLIKMELPFEKNSSPTFEFIIIVQFIHQLIIVVSSGAVNGLIMTMVFHVGGQIDIACKMLNEISTKAESTIFKTVRMVINKHQKIIRFADNIELLFSYVALIQFVSNSITICFLGFVIVTTINLNQSPIRLFKFIGYYFAVMAEAFVFCYAGEYLSNKSLTICDSAYKCFWYNLTPDNNKLLLLLMMRSQKRLTMTIGKFMDLSLQRFASILKASASYVSVLHAVY